MISYSVNDKRNRNVYTGFRLGIMKQSIPITPVTGLNVIIIVILNIV